MRNQLKLENLYKQYAKTLYFYLLKLSGSTQLAEDLTQETFVRATVHLHTYEGEEARAWLFKVARNAYLDEWRKQKRRRTLPLFKIFSVKEEMISPYGLPEDALITKETHEQLEDLLEFLPEQYRSIIYLREFEEFSYKEMMEALQLTEEQVKVTLHRARTRLASLAKRKGWNHDRME
ncbi:sigma-70 family RNA polymerase sigma factor [Oceanobacillus manasiensis]|uniref:sigma-70 family RNA polymerase sigma factor n=1 Tax=Oceanobacillus manasiensis TaxID=586413 RepID=UPI0005AA0E1C|nr:sigma-70 family RNA polymerase sigma factor [Oceanobacillus manasiensis]